MRRDQIPYGLVCLLVAVWVPSIDSAFVWTDVAPDDTKSFYERPCRDQFPNVDNQFTFSVSNPNDTATPFTFAILSDLGLLRVSSVNNNTGLVALASAWDYEIDQDRVTIQGHLTAHQGNATETIAFLVNPIDSNDEIPLFSSETPRNVDIVENNDTFALNISAWDRDFTEAFGTESITLTVVGDNGEFFEIEPVTYNAEDEAISGVLYLKGGLDFETRSFFTLTLTATDGPDTYCGFINSRTFLLTVTVLDDEDQPPRFLTNEPATTIEEQLPLGSYVTQVTAEDGDRGVDNPIQYSIVSGNDGNWFTIGLDDGYITTQAAVDLESSAVINLGGVIHLVVQATEVTAKPNHAHTATNKISIYITDVNDNPPKFNQLFFNAQIVGNATVGAVVGVSPRITDPDQSSNAVFNIDINDPSGAFAVKPVNATGSTAVSLVVVDAVALSAQINRVVLVEVTASDPNVVEFTETAVIEIAVTAPAMEFFSNEVVDM